jgi:hypothetical protein
MDEIKQIAFHGKNIPKLEQICMGQTRMVPVPRVVHYGAMSLAIGHSDVYVDLTQLDPKAFPLSNRMQGQVNFDYAWVSKVRAGTSVRLILASEDGAMRLPRNPISVYGATGLYVTNPDVDVQGVSQSFMVQPAGIMHKAFEKKITAVYAE